MLFLLFCVFYSFAQGFSLKMQLFDQTTLILLRFIRWFATKTLPALILDTFASEPIIKHMLFKHFDIFGGNTIKLILCYRL